MKQALHNSGVSVDQLDYVNAHATSTPAGDLAEIVALKRLLQLSSGEETPRRADDRVVHVSSFKGSLGHCLGAAGAIEFALTALACHKHILPPSINIEQVDKALGLDSPECRVRIVANEKKELTPASRPMIALKNSFGFGGTNSSICIRSFHEQFDSEYQRK